MRYNAPKSCATRSCCACVDLITCVAERYLTLRTGYERYGRKNPLPFLISERSHIGNLRRIRKQGKGRSSKRKENRRLSFLFAHRRGYGVVLAAGRGTFPPSADGESPAEVQRKTSRPERANSPASVRAPRWVGAEKEPPRQGEHANAVRVPQSAGAGKVLPTLRAPVYKSKTEVSLGFLLYLRRREPFLRSVAWRTSA